MVLTATTGVTCMARLRKQSVPIPLVTTSSSAATRLSSISVLTKRTTCRHQTLSGPRSTGLLPHFRRMVVISHFPATNGRGTPGLVVITMSGTEPRVVRSTVRRVRWSPTAQRPRPTVTMLTSYSNVYATRMPSLPPTSAVVMPTSSTHTTPLSSPRLRYIPLGDPLSG